MCPAIAKLRYPVPVRVVSYTEYSSAYLWINLQAIRLSYVNLSLLGLVSLATVGC